MMLGKLGWAGQVHVCIVGQVLEFTDLEHGLPVADGGLALLQTAHDGLQPPSVASRVVNGTRRV